MASLQSYKTEIILLIFSFVFLLFTLTNINVNLGQAYLWFCGIALFLLLINILVFDKNVRVAFGKNGGNWGRVFFYGIAGWVIVLIASFLIFKFVEPSVANFGAIIKSFGASNPAFSNSVILNFIIVSFIIGFSETQLFAGRLLEFIGDIFHIQINKNNVMNIKFILLAVFLSVIFAVFHITAKGINATSSLIVVAIMMLVSIILVALEDGDTRSAVVMHVLSNGIAGWMLIQSGGLKFS